MYDPDVAERVKVIQIISKLLWIAGVGDENTLVIAAELVQYLKEKGYSIVPTEEVYY